MGRIDQLERYIEELGNKLDNQPYYSVMAVKADHNRLCEYEKELKELIDSQQSSCEC
jgi:hypothetical protein